ncbi:MAG: hypothetical protein PHX56_08520 [Atribacterota bacterium]|nr:hypothetical protein [Atribacterota bacterium]
MSLFFANQTSFIVRISINCPAKDTGKNIRAGQFQDMLGIEEGIKRRKEIQEAIHPPDHKMP